MMSAARACLPCRVAKAKCDHVTPACGRCRQRGLTCSGLASDVDFMFRHEDETAQRNSKRARRERTRAPVISFDLIPSQASHEQQTELYAHMSLPSLRLQYSWLNDRALAEVPGPLKRDLETRAVDRFFVNWVLHPRNDGASPGYMHVLPTLYLNVPPESVLWFAVRAVAFADMKHESAGGTPFHIKARQSYGAALSRIRMAAYEHLSLANDRVLAAILLIDDFESVYLARTEPLGPHRDAIIHILHARGDDQLFDQSRFALWRVAHGRLQTRQFLLREAPDSEQIAWMSKLNLDRPDIHISADVMHMNLISAAAKTLTQNSEDIEATPSEQLEQVRMVVQESLDLIASIENWTSKVTGVWKPRMVDARSIAQPLETDDPSGLPIPHFTCPRTLSYHDLWLAYIWNCHAASQIVFRESLVDVINYRAILQAQELDTEDMERIQAERDAVDRLSAAIIWSIPPLLGFTHKDSQGLYSSRQGKMAGRFFSLFSLWVVQRAQFTPLEHKRTASDVTEWINSRHGLG